MKKHHSLFELIQSLTKSEKRLIKLNAQMHKGDKVYLTLMDAIAEQKEYNEKELLEKFKDEEFIKQFSVAKNYLQNFILKQLRQYHAGLKASIECKNLLIEVEILFWKGQYKLAEKTILKTKKIAQKYEHFFVLEELNYWQNRIHNALLKLNKNYKTTFEYDSKEHIGKYLNILEYKELISTAQLLTKQSDVIRDENEKKAYYSLLNNPLLKDISSAQSNEAKYNHYVLNSVIYKIVGDLKKSDDYRKKLLNFLETNPHLIEENPIHYIAALHNMLTQQLITHDYENFKNYLHKLKTYNFKMPHERANVFSSLCLFELGYYSEIKDYNSAVQFVEETVVKYENVNDLINMEHRFLLNYQAALAYYHTQEFHKALKWINKILGITNRDLRLDLRSSTYVLNILTHYELHNFDLLPYLAKSTLSFLKTSKMLRKPDEIFLAIFNNTSLSLNKKEWIEFLTKKKNELLSTRSKSIIISDINYIEWIDRKLN